MSKKRIAVFIACSAFFAALAWVGGYDFKERNFYVALCTLVATGGSFLIASEVDE